MKLADEKALQELALKQQEQENVFLFLKEEQ